MPHPVVLFDGNLGPLYPAQWQPELAWHGALPPAAGVAGLVGVRTHPQPAREIPGSCQPFCAVHVTTTFPWQAPSIPTQS